MAPTCTETGTKVSLDTADSGAPLSTTAECYAAYDTSGVPDGDGDGYDVCVDCDDTDAAVNPGAIDFCDGQDNNCDGKTDNGPGSVECYSYDMTTDECVSAGWYCDALTFTSTCPDGLMTQTDCAVLRGPFDIIPPL